MKDFKSKIIIIFSLFIKTALVITPSMLNAMKGNNFYILFFNLIFIISYLLIFNLDHFKLKWLINARIIKYINIIFIAFLMLSMIIGTVTLINNVYYLKTPLSVITFSLMFLTIILSFNKKSNLLNLYFVLAFTCLLTVIIYGVIFPKSYLNIPFEITNYKLPYLTSYLVLLIDLIYYKLYFTTSEFNFSLKKQIFTIILTFIIIAYFTYKDLTISDLNFNHLYFPNLLKYRVAGIMPDIHLDFIVIIWILIGCVFKCVIYGDLIRIFLKKQKKEKNYLFIFLIIFFIANTIANMINKDNYLLNIILEISSIGSFIIILLLGGLYVACRIYQKK